MMMMQQQPAATDITRLIHYHLINNAVVQHNNDVEIKRRIADTIMKQQEKQLTEINTQIKHHKTIVAECDKELVMLNTQGKYNIHFNNNHMLVLIYL